MSKAVVTKVAQGSQKEEYSYHSSIRKWVAFDLGTANLRFLTPTGKERLTVHPAMAAVNQNTGKMLQFGLPAKQMQGRTPEHIQVSAPLAAQKVPTDVVSQMIRHALFPIAQKTFLSPDVLLSVPTGTDAETRQEWMRAVKEAGAHKVASVEPIYAAALGAGWDPRSTKGFMIVDIGGSITSIAVLSMGTLAASRLLPIGGMQFDQAIQKYIRTKYETVIKPDTAESVKLSIGTVYDKTEETFAEVKGRCLQKGTQKIVTVGSCEMIEAMTEPVTAIVDAVCSLIEQLSEPLLEDVLSSGMLLCGGAGQLFGLDRILTRITGVPTTVAESPETCTVRGLAKLVEKRSGFKTIPLKWY